MKKKILLTRPRAASKRWARILSRHGFDSIVEPLLTIEPLDVPRPQGDFQATFITSANALDALEEIKPDLSDILRLPCFCVGAATAAAARLYGFTDTRCGTSDSLALAQLALKTLGDKSRSLLHITGDTADGKAREELAGNGFTLVSWTVYRAHAAEDFSPATRAAFSAGDIGAVVLFSPRSARILVSLIEKNRLARACHGIAALGLSQAVADVLKLLPWRQLRVAATPAEEEILACLQRESFMTQSETPLPEPSTISSPPPRKPKSGKKLWVFLAAFLLLLIGALALAKFIERSPPSSAVSTKPTLDISELDRRLTTLEARVDKLSENGASSSAANAPDSEIVKNLQNQITQLQNQNKDGAESARKIIAAAFAFWDLREAAKAGRPFASQLSDLRNATTDDAATAAQIAKLAPYAANPPPTLAQLRESLAAQEASLPPPPATEANPTLWTRILALLRPFISVHPLRNPALETLEKTLDSGDDQGALAAFKTLSDDARQKLSAWGNDLDARAQIGAALQAMTVSFATPAPRAETAP